MKPPAPARGAPKEGSPAPLDEADDDALMQLIGQAHRTAFTILLQRHQDWAIGFCLRYLGGRADAEEAAQEAFLTVWTEAPRYKAQSSFRSFLLTILVNRCRTVERSRSRVQRKHGALALEPEPSPAASPEDGLLSDEHRSQVLRRLQTVSPALREALILRYVHGLPIDEIARITGKAEGTVRSSLSRGVARLRKSTGEKKS